MRSPLLATSFVAAAAVLLVSPPVHAQRKYAAAGPSAVQVKTLGSSTTKVVVPTTGTPAPLVVASHGFLASGDNQIGWARHFASWGFVVAVPSFGGGLSPDHEANAQVIADVVGELTGASAAAFSVAPGRFGLEGHSAGGLASALAASAIQPAATVLFDPVDDDAASGKTAYPAVCSSVLTIFADPSSCNKQLGWKAFSGGAKGDVLSISVVGSTHCDGENAPRSLCSFAGCGGGANVDRQAVYAHYATAFFLANLKSDAQAALELAASAIAADQGVRPVERKQGTCAAPAAPDAGASSSSSSGSSSSGSTSGGTSSGTTTETSPTEPGEGAGVTPGGAADAGGCNVSEGRSAHRSLALLATLGLSLVAVRRRRHARG